MLMRRLQHLTWVPVLFMEMFPSSAGCVPRQRKPPGLPWLLSRLCPAAGRCSPGSPCLPQLSSWPWLPGLAGHAPVPLTLAKPVLGSCPVPRCFEGSVPGSSRAPSPARGAAPAQDEAGLMRCRNLGPCCRRGWAVDFRSVALFSWQQSWAGAAWEPGSAWSRGRGRSSSLLRNPPPASCSTGRAQASPP